MKNILLIIIIISFQYFTFINNNILNPPSSTQEPQPTTNKSLTLSIDYSTFETTLDIHINYIANDKNNNIKAYPITFSLDQAYPYNFIFNNLKDTTNSLYEDIMISSTPIKASLESISLQLNAGINSNKGTILYDIEYYNIAPYQANTSKIRPIKNTLTLAYKIDNVNFSLVYQLKKLNVIDYLAYTIRPLTFFQGYILFGQAPPDKFGYKQWRGSCSIDKTKTTFGCFLSNIKMTLHKEQKPINEILKVNEYVSYQFNQRKMKVSCEFLNYIRKNYLNTLIEKELCHEINENGKRFFTCSVSISVELFPFLSFEFNGVTIQVSLKELFVYSNQRNFASYFECYDDSNSNNNMNWMFGSILLENFITTYDYEQHVVTFDVFDSQYKVISNDITINYINELVFTHKNHLCLMKVCIIIMSILSTYLLLIKYEFIKYNT